MESGFRSSFAAKENTLARAFLFIKSVAADRKLTI
jgi:hypothetical protein